MLRDPETCTNRALNTLLEQLNLMMTLYCQKPKPVVTCFYSWLCYRRYNKGVLMRQRNVLFKHYKRNVEAFADTLLLPGDSRVFACGRTY
jgi:hypothetical protein